MPGAYAGQARWPGPCSVALGAQAAPLAPAAAAAIAGACGRAAKTSTAFAISATEPSSQHLPQQAAPDLLVRQRAT